MRSIALREAIREAMSEEMRRDERVLLMGEEVAEYNGAYKVSQGMLAEFGAKRVIDTPISELGFTAVAVGAAQNGLRPIVEFMTWNFAVLPLDQILNTASKMLAMSGGQIGCPIVMRGPNGSAGQLGAQHSTAFESYLANIPGIKVVSISNGYDAKGLLLAAIEDPNPIIYFEHKYLYRSLIGPVPEGFYIVEIGKANVLKEGQQLAIITYGLGVHWALDYLKANPQIAATVIDLVSLQPWDKATVEAAVKATGRVLILHEDTLSSGFGAEISAWISEHCFEYLDAPVMRCASLDTAIPMSKVLEDDFLAKARLEKTIEKLISY